MRPSWHPRYLPCPQLSPRDLSILGRRSCSRAGSCLKAAGSSPRKPCGRACCPRRPTLRSHRRLYLRFYQPSPKDPTIPGRPSCSRAGSSCGQAAGSSPQRPSERLRRLRNRSPCISICQSQRPPRPQHYEPAPEDPPTPNPPSCSRASSCARTAGSSPRKPSGMARLRWDQLHVGPARARLTDTWSSRRPTLEPRRKLRQVFRLTACPASLLHRCISTLKSVRFQRPRWCEHLRRLCPSLRSAISCASRHGCR
mmetsp:Transcript_54229/g.137777  ORF Transcript_54229/g.137777 Transcript_54229/m.137777 type:complete len:254 (-) Transcript_54229:55-816(-)